MKDIEWLMSWFSSNCDGEWEHSYSISIKTLDNPGWAVTVDIAETKDEGKELAIESFNSDDDWYRITCDGEKLEAFGDPSKLEFMLQTFRRLTEN